MNEAYCFCRSPISGRVLHAGFVPCLAIETTAHTDGQFQSGTKRAGSID